MIPSNATALPGQEYAAYAVLCGRMSIWPLRDEALHSLQGSPPIGTCLLLEPSTGIWRLEERDNHAVEVLAHGLIKADKTDDSWHTLALGFSGATVSFAIDGDAVNSTRHTQQMNGVAGFGSGWHHAYFDDMSLTQEGDHGLTPGSFLLDVTPMGTQQAGQNSAANGIAQPIVHTAAGWAGFVLAIPNGTAPLSIDRLARFKLVNGLVNATAAGKSLAAPGVPNKGKHSLGIFDEVTGSSMLAHEVTVDMSTCTTDALGFCWSRPFSPASLQPGRSYVIAAQEDGVDGYVEMTDPATGTKMGHRIGTTYMSYVTPGAGAVIGRAWRAAGAHSTFTITPEVDTTFGPVNFGLAK
eukprot:COSAG01_NODE_4660_length_4842_cov_22.777567_5_plen_353_part_00